MALAIATRGAPGDHLADILIKLEAKLSPELALTTLAVRHMGGAVTPYVIVHLDDGSRETLTAGDARLIGRAIRDDAEPLSTAADWADSFDEAADAADRQAAACVMHRAAGGGIGRRLSVVPAQHQGGAA